MKKSWLMFELFVLKVSKLRPIEVDSFFVLHWNLQIFVMEDIVSI